MELRLSVLAYTKLMSYVRNCDMEISGLGWCDFDKEIIYVNDIILLKQTVTGSTTDIDDDAQAKFLFEQTKNGRIKDLCLWWHSHVDMACFWSSVDDATIERSKNSDFMVSIVANKNGDMLARLDIFKPARITIEIPKEKIGICYQDVDIDKQCIEEIGELVISEYKYVWNKKQKEIWGKGKIKKNYWGNMENGSNDNGDLSKRSKSLEERL